VLRMAALVSRTNGNIVVTARITLIPGRDDDLIALITQAPKGALAGIIRDAMRNGAVSGAVEQAFDEIDTSGLGLEI
jgi:hypothetical protein